MKYIPSLRSFLLSLIVAVVVQPMASASNPPSWKSAASPTSLDLTRVVFGAGVFVALGPGNAGDTVVLWSVDGANWEESVLPADVDVADVVFGGGTFFAVGELNDLPVAVKSSDGVGWSLVESFPANTESLASAAFLQGYYWAMPATGPLYLSTDLEVWTEVQRGPVMTLLGEHEGRLLIPRHDSIGSSPWEGGAIFWEFPVTLPAPAILSLASRDDRAVALLANETERLFAVSGDGIMWLAFGYGPAGLNFITATSDHFLAVGDGIVLSSTDGARWADRSEGVGNAVLRSIAAGNGALVTVGDGGAIFRRESALPPGVLGEPPAVKTVPEGQPLFLAVEVEGGAEVSVHWHKDLEPIEGATGTTFRIEAVSPSDAGAYVPVVTNDSGIEVQAGRTELTVAEPVQTPVAWEEVGALHIYQPPTGGPAVGPEFSRIAAQEGVIFAFAHEGSFEGSIYHYSPENPLPAAWSENGLHWREAFLPQRAPAAAAGTAGGRLWISGTQGRIGFSTDGIAWRQSRLPSQELVTLVGVHEGNLFANGGNYLWTSADNGKTWTSDGGPMSDAGGYFSEEGLLIVSGQAGVWQRTTTWESLLPRFMQIGSSYQARLVGSREKAVVLSRGGGVHAVSRDMRNWTTLFNPFLRDVVYVGDEFVAVGPGGAFSSIDGVWWGDRSAGLNLTTVSGVARAGDALFAVGNIGRIFRRPALLEPGFYQQPLDVTALPGQPVRMTARVVDDGSVEVQWYRLPEPCGDSLPCDDTPVIIEGAVGPVLEIPEVGVQDAGGYMAVASGATGSAASRVARLTVESGPPANPWVQVGVIAPLPDGFGGPNPNAFVWGNGVSLGSVPHYPGHFVATEDGATWLRGAISNHANRLSFAGECFFASGNEGPHKTLISHDGFSWTPTTLPWVNAAAYAEGVYVAATPEGLYWSEDLEEWTLGAAVVNCQFIAWGNGRFVAIGGNPLRSQVSIDGKQWAAHDLPTANTNQTPLALVFGNDAFLLGAISGDAGFFHRSADGETWTSGPRVSLFSQLLFSAGNFWKVGNWLGTSADGVTWVERVAPPAGFSYRKLAFIDEAEVVFQYGDRAFRRSGLLEPIIYSAVSGAHGAFPGEEVTLRAPAAHGTGEFTYQWWKNGEFLEEASRAELTLKDFEASDGAMYTVAIANPSGSDSAGLEVRYLGGYSEWSDYFRISNQPRQPGDDPGGRGIANLLRYALHLDPNNPDRSRLPRLEVEEMDGQRFPVLHFQLLADTEHFVWRVEGSSDLTAWEPLESGVVEVDTRQASHRELAVRDPRPLGEDERRFLRLLLELIDPEEN